MTNESDALRDAVVARELFNSFADPDFHAGSAEPWLAAVLAALVVANATRNCVEIGGFEGYTSRHLLHALRRLPHVTSLTVCEIDSARAQAVQNALTSVAAPTVETRVVIANSHDWIPTLPDESVDFAWLDGNHEMLHVHREIELLMPKMRVNGIMALHDVFGVCRLNEVVTMHGGYSLNLPRLGPAGGLGLIQRRP